MKKLISILASLTLVASSSSAVVSCTNTNKQNGQKRYARNDINNIAAASFEKAKQVIINNEYGIDESITKGVQQTMLVKNEGLDNINYKELGGNDTDVASLVSQYYGDSVDNNTTIDAGNKVDLGGQIGASSTIDFFLGKVLDLLGVNPAFRSDIYKAKDALIGLLINAQDSVNMKKLSDFNTDAYNKGLAGQDGILNTALQIGITALGNQVSKESDTKGIFHKIAGFIVKVLKDKDTFANDTLINKVFNSDTMKMVRGVAGALMNGNGKSTSPLQDAVYANGDIVLPDFSSKKDSGGNTQQFDDAPKTVSLKNDYLSKFSDFKIPEIKDTLSQDVKKEILSSIDRVLSTIFDFSVIDKTLPKATDFVTDLENKVSSLVAVIVGSNGKLPDGAISKDAGSEASIIGYVWEALRDISIMNAQFNMFEDTYAVEPVDSQHLFGTMTNYEYLNSKKDIKLGDTDFVKYGNEPINLNYFLSNLNFYLGGLDNKNEKSVYLVQRLGFILLNDPSTPIGNSKDDKGWDDKQSDILDFIVKTGLNVGIKICSAKGDTEPYKTINGVLTSIMGSQPTIASIENIILKPLILGLVNGDNLGPLLTTVTNGLDAAYNNIPSVKTLLDSLSALGINIRQIIKALKRACDDNKIGSDTVHELFVGDFRHILAPIKDIPQEWMNKLFGPDDGKHEVNLYQIIEKPLSDFLTMFGVKGFEGGKISPIGDYFTSQSIPNLINFLNGYMNGMNGNIPEKYAVMRTDGKTIDLNNSLKARDINFTSLYDLFISIVGTDKQTGKGTRAENNIFTNLLNDLVETKTDGIASDYSNFGTAVKAKISFLDAMTDLGVEDEVQKSGQSWPKSAAYQLDDSTIIKPTYDTTGKITFDLPDDVASDIADGELDNGSVTLNPNAPDAGITNVNKSGKTITVTLAKPYTEVGDPQPVSVTFQTTGKDGKAIKLNGTFDVPGKFTGGTDLVLKDRKFLASLYRTFLPELDLDQPTGDVTMHDKYLEVDLLHSYYVNLTNLAYYFNKPGYYDQFVTTILDYKRSFGFRYDKDKIKYFKDHKGLIRQVTFTVSFVNYVSGETNEYRFTVSRQSNIQAFKIDEIITNKTV